MSSSQRSFSTSRPTSQRVVTPSTSIPVVAVQRWSASEYKANGYSSAGATALRAKVASSPPTTNLSTPSISGPPSPDLASDSQSSQDSFRMTGHVTEQLSGACSSIQDAPGNGGEQTR